MKHTVGHSCGHPAEHDLAGSPGHQAWEVKRRAAGPCPICWKAEADSENALNAAFAAEQQLPELVGTPKQVAWAVSIRADFLAQLPDQMGKLREAVAQRHGVELPQPVAALDVVREIACAETSAPWWIRNRFRIAASLGDRNGGTLRMSDAAETAARLLSWIRATRR